MLNNAQIKSLVSDTINQLSLAFGGRSQITDDLIHQAILGKLNNSFVGATKLCFIKSSVEVSFQQAEFWGEEEPTESTAIAPALWARAVTCLAEVTEPVAW